MGVALCADAGVFLIAGADVEGGDGALGMGVAIEVELVAALPDGSALVILEGVHYVCGVLLHGLVGLAFGVSPRAVDLAETLRQAL